MTPTVYVVTFWRPGSDDYCPDMTIRRFLEYDEAATVCASLKARGYLLQVHELTEVDIPVIDNPH